jgi:glycosyltransferase involved in cell wall biosynthesis
VRSIVQSSDAVVARLPSEIGLLAVRHAKQLKKPYAVELVGCAWDGLFHNGSLKAQLYAPLGYIRNRHAIAQAPLVLYVTSSWLQRRYPTEGESEIASNVYLDPMDEAALQSREKRLAELAKGRWPILGTVASLYVRSKGIQTAIAALARLRSSGLDLEYRVLGAGPAEHWRALAARFGVGDLVHFDGTRSAGEGVSSWLDKIDLHLQPSFQEGLPRATIEAMSRGVACVGSTCGGIPELLPEPRLHRPGDFVALSRIIERLVNDPAKISAASKTDFEASRAFDIDELRKRRNRFYSRLREHALKAAG